MYRSLLELCFLFIYLPSTTSMVFKQTKCRGAHLILQCQPEHFIQVDSVRLMYSSVCEPRANSLQYNCTLSSNKFHDCTGVRTCIVKVPTIQIERCGVSNGLEMVYSCVNESQVADICDTSQDLTAPSGYLSTPGYPDVWQPITGTCSVTISLPRGWRIRFYILDQGQEVGDHLQGCIFLVIFRALLNKRRTGLFPETSVCLDNGYVRRELIYESSSNIVQFQYRVLLPVVKTGEKFGFLFYYEGYQPTTSRETGMSSTTVPPTIVLQPGQESMHVDRLFQLKRYFSTPAVPLVHPFIRIQNATRGPPDAQQVTFRPGAMHTDVLGLIETRDSQQASQAPATRGSTSPRVSKRVSTSTEQPTEPIIPEESSTTSSAHQHIVTITTTTTDSITQQPEMKSTLSVGINQAQPVITPSRTTTTTTTSSTTTTGARMATVEMTSAEEDSTTMDSQTAPEARQPNDGTSSRVGDSVLTVFSLTNNSSDLARLATRNGTKDGSSTGETSLDVMSGTGVNGMSPVPPDVYHTTGVQSDVYNTTGVQLDVYNTTAVPTSNEWKTKWAKLVGGLMVALAFILMLTVIAIMVAERHRTKHQHELQINEIFDNVSHHLGCDDGSEMMACDTMFNNSVYTGSTATMLPADQQHGWQNEAFVPECRHFVLPHGPHIIHGDTTTVYENYSGGPASGGSPLIAKDRPPSHDVSWCGSRVDSLSSDDRPRIVSRTSSQQSCGSRLVKKKLPPPVPERRSVLANQAKRLSALSNGDGRKANAVANSARDSDSCWNDDPVDRLLDRHDSYSYINKQSRGHIRKLHSVVIELRNNPATDSVRHRDERNDVISTLPVYSYTSQ